MKKTINGKQYDTALCETLGEIDHYHNGNYSGTTSLERASDGTLLIYTSSNGQDLYLRDKLYLFDLADLTIKDRDRSLLHESVF